MAGTRKPVIAGQSGHAGGQALTVTRRSLAGAPGIAMPLAGLI
jgi:Mg/Co/Ni transporter MgtE